jgi:hypothetical protein
MPLFNSPISHSQGLTCPNVALLLNPSLSAAQRPQPINRTRHLICVFYKGRCRRPIRSMEWLPRGPRDNSHKVLTRVLINIQRLKDGLKHLRTL